MDEFDRFREVAEADQSPGTLDRVFGRLDVRRKPDADDAAKVTDEPERDG